MLGNQDFVSIESIVDINFIWLVITGKRQRKHPDLPSAESRVLIFEVLITIFRCHLSVLAFICLLESFFRGFLDDPKVC